MKNTLFIALFFFTFASAQNQSTERTRTDYHRELEEEFLDNCARKYNYTYQMSEWQNCLDEGIKKDSTYAYFWQQKAMPYFKAKKYEIGMEYIDKAVLYDAKRWQPYRAFIKCIFIKSYREAILDFEDCKNKFGNDFVMDHTFDFYIALSYLQLNEFGKAEVLLQGYVNQMLAKNGESWVHQTALFYLGISKYEQKRYEEAIIDFDRALKNYSSFSEVKFYKAICMLYLGENPEEIKKY